MKKPISRQARIEAAIATAGAAADLDVEAMLVQKKRTLRAPRLTEADLAAFKASAGSMRELIDADEMIEETSAARGDRRPDVEL